MCGGWGVCVQCVWGDGSGGVCKIHQFGWHIPVYLTYVKFHPLPLPIGPSRPSCRGTQILISLTPEYIVMRILQPNNKKKSVGKGYAEITLSKWCPYSKGNFKWKCGVEEWKHRPFYDGRAPFGCPLSPGARGFAHPEPIGVTPLLLGFVDNSPSK